MEGVSKELCEDRNSNTVKRLDKHSEEIDDLKVIVAKLTVLVENHEKKMTQDNITSKVSFWQSPIGIRVISTLCIMGIAITFAAIGMNYFKEYLGVIAK
jgi:hypothetical protein